MKSNPIAPEGKIRSERLTVPGGKKPLLRLYVDSAEPTTLLPFLIKALPDKSRTTIKQLLHDRFISIGLEATTQFDAPLKAGDEVNIHPAPLPKKFTHKGIEILYQDEYLIVIHKDAGLPTVASGEEKDKTALRLLSDHQKSFNPRAKVYHINRLDKDSAGFVVFAKSRDLQCELSDHWSRYVRGQHFAAVLEGHPQTDNGILLPPPSELDPKKDRGAKKGKTTGAKPSSDDERTAGRAEWHTLVSGPSRVLVSVALLTGRNNRLRRQFAQLRLPIAGDWRNGSTEKELGRVALEGTHLSFVHPVTGKLLEFRQPIPPLFRKLVKGAQVATKNPKKIVRK